MKRILLILLISVAFISCAQKIFFGNKKLLRNYPLITILELRNNPEKYHGDTIRITGKVNLSYEHYELYNTEFPLALNEFEPAIDYIEAWQIFNGENVEIIGLFEYGSTGHLGSWEGGIEKIFYIRRL